MSPKADGSLWSTDLLGDDDTIDEAPDENTEDKKLARTEFIGAIIDTGFEDGVYRTYVIVIGYNEGQKTVIARYPSRELALQGHMYWSTRFEHSDFPTADELIKNSAMPDMVYTDEISITWKPLMTILSRMTDKHTSLLINRVPETTHFRIWIQANEKWAGMLRYDPKNRIAYQISPVWYHYIHQAKDDISDKSSFFDNRGLSI